MPQLDIADAKYCLSELIEKAIAGEEVMITRDNQPVVKLVPILPLRRRQPGSAKGLISISDDFDEPLELVPSSQVIEVVTRPETGDKPLGEEVMIAKDNQPVVKLAPIFRTVRGPIEPSHRRQPGSAKGLISISDDFDEPLELVPSSQVKLVTGIEEVAPETDDKLLVD